VGYLAYLYAQPQRLRINLFHTAATLKCAIQQKTKCMQRFTFTSQFGQTIRKYSLHTELHISGTRTSSCFGTIDRKFGSVFLPSVVHGLAPVIADVNSRNVGLCCRCLTAWREATSCCFARPRCFGHSEIFHSTFKNENFCTDLCIWKPLEMVAASGVFKMQALAFFKISRCWMTTTGTNLLCN